MRKGENLHSVCEGVRYTYIYERKTSLRSVVNLRTTGFLHSSGCVRVYVLRS